MASEKKGVSVPLLMVKAERFALVDGARVTVTVYVFIVVPLDAVTATLMVLAPADREIAPDAEPDVHTGHVRSAIGNLHQCFEAPVIRINKIYQPEGDDGPIFPGQINDVSNSTDGRDL